MSITQPPATVPYAELLAERQAHARTRELLAQERKAHTETRQQLALERQRQQQHQKLWRTKLKSTEKATLEEFDRQLQSPQAHRDEQGFTRLCYTTAAINTGTTPNTPKLSFEKTLAQCPDLLTLAGAEIDVRKEYDPDLKRPIPRLYIKAEKSLAQAAIHSEISQHIKQGGNQYICQRCGSNNVTILRRLHCNNCHHETDLEPTFPNGKLKSSTGINGNTNLESPPQMGYSSENEQPPAEKFLSTSEQVVGMVITSITSDPPLEADKLSEAAEAEAEAKVIEEAAALLLAIAGDDENHIEMSRTGPKKYYDVKPPRPLELADLVDHLHAGQARGSCCCYRDGTTQGLCFDTDDGEEWKLWKLAARKLVQAGYIVVLDESPAGRGGHLWIIFDGRVNAAAARAAVLQVAPELAECEEYWPGPADAKNWNRVRLPGGFYARYGKHVEQPIKAWCRLSNVATGEIASDGRSAAKLLLASLTPAAIVPVIDSESALGISTQDEQQAPACIVVEQESEVLSVSARRAGALLNTNEAPEIAITGAAPLPYKLPEVDARWVAEHGPVETTTLYFAILPDYAAESYNRDHPLEEIRPREQNGMAFSPNGPERTPSTNYRETEDGERYTDHSQHGRRSDGTRDSGDALELTSKVQGIGKRELFRMSTGQIVAKARADLEAAARSGQPIPDWLEYPICIITPAGRRYYERLLSEARSVEQSAPAPFTIYVDEIQIYETALPYKKWCHLAIAGPIEELHVFASKLGLKREWFQDKPGHPHYDLTPAKRVQAVELGAVAVSTLDLVKRCYPAMVSGALEQKVDPVAVQQEYDQVGRSGGQEEQREQKLACTAVEQMTMAPEAEHVTPCQQDQVEAELSPVMVEIRRLDEIKAYGQVHNWPAFGVDGKEVIPAGRSNWLRFIWLAGQKDLQRQVHAAICGTGGLDEGKVDCSEVCDT